MTSRPDPGQAARAPFVPPDGWGADDLDAALVAFRRMRDHPLAEIANAATSAREFFETRFAPMPSVAARITGYFEPELDASLTRSAEFCVPVHAVPEGGCSLRRAEIDTRLNGAVLAWVRDEVDRFFLQVQGSGRLRLTDGSTRRLGYGGSNGHPYRSIGQVLIERRVFGMDLTAEQLKDWLRADLTRGRALMDENPSYVFFRVHSGPSEDGPIGTMGYPVTTGRTVACDPVHTPLGTPVWVQADGLNRLCVAQDTGSAIKGPGRLDLFHGTGVEAGVAAGEMNLAGRMTPLRPR